jgi:hypothetical protein
MTQQGTMKHALQGPRGFGDGTLLPFTDSIWTATTPIRFAVTWFPHVMTVIRLSNDELLLHSPCRPVAKLIDGVAQIGNVALKLARFRGELLIRHQAA